MGECKPLLAGVIWLRETGLATDPAPPLTLASLAAVVEAQRAEIASQRSQIVSLRDRVATLEEAARGEAGGARGAEGGSDFVRNVAQKTAASGSAPAATPAVKGGFSGGGGGRGVRMAEEGGTLPGEAPHAQASDGIRPAAPPPRAAPAAVTGRPHSIVHLAGEVDEDELLDQLGLPGLNWLRAQGLLTYPSPLLGRLLEDMHLGIILQRLDPADRAILAQVGPRWLAAVVSSGFECAGKTPGAGAYTRSRFSLTWAVSDTLHTRNNP